MKRGERIQKHNKVDMAKSGWKPTIREIPRGKPTPTNHTDLETLAPNHVKMG